MKDESFTRSFVPARCLTQGLLYAKSSAGIESIMKKKSGIFLILFCLLLFLVPSGVQQGSAVGDGTVIRVGLYPLGRYHYYDENGTPAGYEVEYLSRIAEETGWSYEYVFLESWSLGEELLMNGELDLLSPAEMTRERVNDFLFTDSALGGSYMIICTTDSGMRYEDITAISKMRIATEKGTSLVERYRIWAEMQGIPYNLIEYDSYELASAALKRGDVDALLRSSFEYTDGLNVVARISYSEYYFMMNAQNVDLKNELDEAVTALQIANPLFRIELTDEYFQDINKDPITVAEQTMIEELDPICIAVPVDRRPMAYLDSTGKVTGIAIEILEKIAENTGLRFQYIPYANGAATANALLSGECSLKIPAGLPATLAYGLEGLVQSEVLMDFALSVVSVNGADPTGKDSWTVAVTEDSVGMGDVIEKTYGNCEVYRYSDWNAACDALLKGEVDAVAVNNAAASYQLQKPRYEKICLVSSVSISTPICVGGFDESREIIKIINKSMKQLDSGMIQNIITKYTSIHDYEYRTADYLYKYKGIIITLAAVLILILILLLIYRNNRKKYEAALLKNNRDLEEATCAKERFFSHLSHDIRTPMNGILGTVEITRGCGRCSEYETALEDIKSAGDFMMMLLNDVLDISKINNNNYELCPEFYPFPEFEKTIHSVMEPRAKEKNITFLISCSFTENMQAKLDRIRIQQIFINLLGNAVKFTPNGGKVELLINHQVIRDGIWNLELTVRDNGCGMSEEFVRTRLFKEFEQERNDNNRESGTGLGMFIVKKLIDKMGGSIDCSSVPGEGTVLHVLLSEVEVQPYSGKTDSNTELPAYTGLVGKRILLCEDQPLNTKVAKKLLEREGMIVETAENGQIGTEMVAAAEPYRYDAILMDLRMPVMDGFRASEVIRGMNREDAKTIPIIAMSANTSEEDVSASFQAGMNAHLSKPIEPDKLYHTLNYVTQQKQPQQK